MTTRPFVRTVLGDMDPSQMGLTYSHEHIIIEESFPTVSNPLFILNDVDKVSRELIGFHMAGGGTVVDTMPANCGRSAEKLAEVSRRSKVNIIAPTGIHLEMYYLPNHWRYSYTADQLSDLFTDDITLGIDRHDYGAPIVERTPYKAGLIKLATSDEVITGHQQKLFEAAVNAHLQTGAPILTHTNGGKLAMEQVELFARLGANLNHVVISHVDKNRDLGFHHDLMQTGVYVEYDSHFRWKTTDDNWTLSLLEALLPHYADHIVLGMDMAKNSYWKSYGGSPGLNYLLTQFRDDLESRDLDIYFDKLFFSNPQKLYTFTNI